MLIYDITINGDYTIPHCVPLENADTSVIMRLSGLMVQVAQNFEGPSIPSRVEQGWSG